jgi:hypothetical protein
VEDAFLNDPLFASTFAFHFVISSSVTAKDNYKVLDHFELCNFGITYVFIWLNMKKLWFFFAKQMKTYLSLRFMATTPVIV